MITWNDVADYVAKMTSEDRAKWVVGQDQNTGELFGFNSIESPNEDIGFHLLYPSNDTLEVLTHDFLEEDDIYS